jgi:hypothetical protein
MVIDASAAVKWFVTESGSDASRAILAKQIMLSAPDLLAVEVASALVRKFREDEITEGDVRDALHFFGAVPIVYTPVAALLADAVAIAVSHRHPLPDCFYAALARRNDTMLATFDRRLASIARAMDIPLWTAPA